MVHLRRLSHHHRRARLVASTLLYFHFTSIRWKRKVDGEKTGLQRRRREERVEEISIMHALEGGPSVSCHPCRPWRPWRPLTSEPMPRRTDFQLEALEACEWLPVVCWLETRDQIQNDSGYQDRINYRGQDRTATRDEVSTLRSLSTIYLSLYRHQVKSSQVDQSNIIPSSACFFLSFSF